MGIYSTFRYILILCSTIFLFVCMGLFHVSAQAVFQYCQNGEIGEGTFDDTDEFAWSLNGQRVAILHEDTIEVWDVETNTLTNLLPKDKPYAYMMDFAWGPDSNRIAVATTLSVSVHDLQTGDIIYQWKPVDPKDEIYFIDWKPHEETIAIRTLSRVVIWDIQQNRISKSFTVIESFADQIAWSPDSSLLAFSDGYSVNVWNTDKEQMEQPFEIGNGAGSIAWSPDSTHLAVEVIILGITVFNVDTGEKIITLDGTSPFLWLSTGQFVTTSGFGPGEYTAVWNTKSWEELGSILLEDKRLSYRLVLNPDGKTIATISGHQRKILLFDQDTC